MAQDVPAGVMADWITIWQSELAAIAQDREAAEAWIRFVGRAASATSRLMSDAAPGRAGAFAAAGATAPVAASDPALTRLAERVAALERRAGPGLAEPGGADRQS